MDGQLKRPWNLQRFFKMITFDTSNFSDGMLLNESEIIDGLLARDDDVTREFFFGNGAKSCKPLLKSIISYVFSYPVDYDEAVSEFYAYLMENDGYKLRQIQNRNTLFGWIKVSATRYFIKMRDNLIENRTGEPLMKCAESSISENDESRRDARRDMLAILFKMSNERYAYVLQMLIMNDMEPAELAKRMNITVANLYNIKKRAIAEFTRTALSDIYNYGSER